MTERRTPDCRRSMAMVCLKQWTVTRFCFNDGQSSHAVLRCLFSRYCTPWTLRRSPRSLGNRTVPSPRCGSRNHAFSTARVDLAIGVQRSFRSCKYFHENNYDDLGNMRSSAPRRLVCPSAMGFPRLPPVVDCA
jgi:hypothetical protein